MKFKQQNPIAHTLVFLVITFVLLLPMLAEAQVQITLAWQQNTEPEVAGYRIFCRLEGEEYNYSEPEWEGTDTSCTIVIADETRPHYIVARAFNTEGLESMDSDEVNFGGLSQVDANLDGVLDALQCNVDSLEIDDDANVIVIESSEGTCLSNFRRVDTFSPDDFPQDIDFIYGLYAYDILDVGLGNSVVVTITLPQGASPDTFYCYGQTNDNRTDHWYEFLDDGETGAEINENIITLFFNDALRGDNILTNDNLVVGLGGPGYISDGTDKINNPGTDLNDPDNNSSKGNIGCFIDSLLR